MFRHKKEDSQNHTLRKKKKSPRKVFDIKNILLVIHSSLIHSKK